MRGTRTGFGFIAEAPEASLIRAGGNEIDRSRPFTWKIRSAKSSLSVSSLVSFEPSDIAVWSVGINVSPEVMKRIEIEPGQSVSYWRRWIFER